MNRVQIRDEYTPEALEISDARIKRRCFLGATRAAIRAIEIDYGVLALHSKLLRSVRGEGLALTIGTHGR